MFLPCKLIKLHIRLHLALVLLLLCLSACGPILPRPHVFAEQYGQKAMLGRSAEEVELWSSTLASLESVPEPEKEGMLDERMTGAARTLAWARLEYGQAYAPGFFLESALMSAGIGARPASSRWYSDSAPAFQKQAEQQLLMWLQQMIDAGYTRYAIGIAHDGGVSSLALVAISPLMELTRPLPRRIEVGETLNLEAIVQEDLGLIELSLRAPDNAVVEERFPCLGGRVNMDIRFLKKGSYNLELRLAGLWGQMQTVFSLQIAVGKDSGPGRLHPAEETRPDDFEVVMLSRINAVRRGRRRRPMRRMAGMSDPMKDLMAIHTQLPMNSPATVGIAMPLGSEVRQSCELHLSHADNLDSLIEKNVRRPAYLRNAMSSELSEYGAWMTSTDSGFRVTEIFCGPYKRIQNWLGRFPSARNRHVYHQIRNERISQIIGIEFSEDEKDLMRRWLIGNSQLLMDSYGGIPALIQSSAGMEGQSDFHPRVKEALFDEAFVALWEVGWTTNEDNSRHGALKLLLMQALLHQGRVSAYQSELDIMPRGETGEGRLTSGRYHLAQAWLAAVMGQAERAVEHFDHARTAYRREGFHHTAFNIEVQMELLRNAHMPH